MTATGPFEVVALEVDHETERVTGPLVDVVSFDEALGVPPGLLGYRFTIEQSGTASIAFGYQPHPDRPALFEIVKVIVFPSSP